MTKPITPDEAAAIAQKMHTIPSEVIEIFNEMIVANLRGSTAVLGQRELLLRITKRMECTNQEVFDRHWLDVEFFFQHQGWHVVYDKPGYCESDEPTFTFTKPSPGPGFRFNFGRP